MAASLPIICGLTACTQGQRRAQRSGTSMGEFYCTFFNTQNAGTMNFTETPKRLTILATVGAELLYFVKQNCHYYIATSSSSSSALIADNIAVS